MKTDFGKYTYSEIISQGETLQKTWEAIEPQKEKVSRWLDQRYDEVIFTGCGSTYYLSLSAAKHWVSLTKKLAKASPSSELWFYPSMNYTREKTLLVAVSRSGETTETIQAMKVYEEQQKEECLAIGCYPESSIMKNAKVSLVAPDAQESSVAQTRSFSSMFYLTQYLAGLASSNPAYQAELAKIPRQASLVIEKHEATVQKIAKLLDYQHFVFLGSGLFYGVACEAMLKMKEISISVSEAFHFMEFRHGPMSMITEQSMVVGLVSDSRKEEENRVLSDMKKLGATTLAICDRAVGVDADYVIELGSGVSEEARGVLYLPVLQLMAYYRSMEKGLNPDQPCNLESVVRL